MKTSQIGIDFIKKEEGGFQPRAYWDVKGYSIGYGHFGVAFGTVITEPEAERLLRQDVARVENAINNVGAKLSQNQFDALVSLFYNVGTGHIDNFSYDLRTNPNSEKVTNRMRLYNKSGGTVNSVLVKRREREITMYQKKNV